MKEGAKRSLLLLQGEFETSCYNQMQAADSHKADLELRGWRVGIGAELKDFDALATPTNEEKQTNKRKHWCPIQCG